MSSRSPGRAHPGCRTPTPPSSTSLLFVTLGAAVDPTVSPTTTIDGYVMGLARRSFQVH